MEPSFERLSPSTEDQEPISEQRLAIRERPRLMEAASDVDRSQEEALRRDLSSLDHLDLGAKITAVLGLGAHFTSSLIDALPEFKAQFGLTEDIADQVSNRGITITAIAVAFSLISSGLKARLKRRTHLSKE